MAHGLRYFISLRITASHCHPDLPKWLVPRLHRAIHSRLPLSLRVPTVLSYRSTGISTCCPSATTLVLALGPDLPRADQLYSGNLGYSALRIPTSISLLIPAFSLLKCPQLTSREVLRRKCPGLKHNTEAAELRMQLVEEHS